MTQQQGTRTNSIITVLADTLREVLNTLYRNYPEEVRSACTGKCAWSAGIPVELEALLFVCSGDVEI